MISGPPPRNTSREGPDPLGVAGAGITERRAAAGEPHLTSLPLLLGGLLVAALALIAAEGLFPWTVAAGAAAGLIPGVVLARTPAGSPAPGPAGLGGSVPAVLLLAVPAWATTPLAEPFL